MIKRLPNGIEVKNIDDVLEAEFGVKKETDETVRKAVWNKTKISFWPVGNNKYLVNIKGNHFAGMYGVGSDFEICLDYKRMEYKIDTQFWYQEIKHEVDLELYDDDRVSELLAELAKQSLPRKVDLAKQFLYEKFGIIKLHPLLRIMEERLKSDQREQELRYESGTFECDYAILFPTKTVIEKERVPVKYKERVTKREVIV